MAASGTALPYSGLCRFQTALPGLPEGISSEQKGVGLTELYSVADVQVALLMRFTRRQAKQLLSRLT